MSLFAFAPLARAQTSATEPASPAVPFATGSVVVAAPPPTPPFPGTSAAEPGAPTPRPATGPLIQLSNLRTMRDQGLITPAEYASALADIGESTGGRAADALSVVLGKWSTTLYGFAELDVINDSTQSFNDIPGNALVLRPSGANGNLAANLQNTYGGNHGRTQMSIRNSRLGMRMRAPEFHQVRVSGTLETDFEGYLPTPSATTGPTESQFFSSPSLRIRHAYVKVETPYVDLLVGQYWDLFGWQNAYHPNTVQPQGIVGELYSRDAQIRLSHAFQTGIVDVEIAAAMRRPPSRDSQLPEGQGGLRFSVPKWTGMMTAGATGTDIAPASVAVTGDIRQITVPEFSNLPTQSVSLTTEAIAVDAFIPVIPARRGHEGNSLSLSGEFVTGSGMSDLYTGLTGGSAFPTYVPQNTQVQGTTTYPQSIDNGMVNFDLQGNLHAIQWTTFLVGLQYYLPVLDGHVWVSGNYARSHSSNIDQFTLGKGQFSDPTNSYYAGYGSVRKQEDFFDVNLFWQAVPGVRFGLEYANYNDQYADGVHAINNRFVGSGFFIF